MKCRLCNMDKEQAAFNWGFTQHETICRKCSILSLEKNIAKEEIKLLRKMEKQNNKVFIYALVNPRNSEVHYIGSTSRPEKRNYEHRVAANATHEKIAWIAELKTLKLKPVMKILEETTESQCAISECKWYRNYIEQGCQLFQMPVERAVDYGRNLFLEFYKDILQTILSFNLED